MPSRRTVKSPILSMLCSLGLKLLASYLISACRLLTSASLGAFPEPEEEAKRSRQAGRVAAAVVAVWGWESCDEKLWLIGKR